jgi:bacterioferritin-associated ferredoxin
MARIDELFNFLQTPGLTDQQIAAEIGRLGVTAQEVSQLTGVPVADVQSRLGMAANVVGGTTTAGGGTTTAGGGTTTAGGGGGGGTTSPTFNTTQETAFYNFLQTPGLTDAQITAEVGRLGLNAQQISNMTGVPVADVQRRLGGTTTGTTGATTTTTGATTATTPTFATAQEASLYKFLQTPGLTDRQIAAEVNRLGLTGQQISNMTGVSLSEVNARLGLISTQTAAEATAAANATALANSQAALAAANARAAEAARLAALNKTSTNTTNLNTPTNAANFSTFTNWLKATPGLTDQQIAAEMNRLGISTGQVSGLTGLSQNDIQTRFNATAPFSNATQGFAQNFANFQSIPIGAQYNPAVVGGASPYSQVMGQMRPVGNPYAGVVGNLSMGGYDPALYEQIAAGNAARAAANLAGGNTIFETGGNANGGDTAGIGSQGGDSAGNTGGGPGTGAVGDTAYAMGGMVNGLFGMNPPGPDDGAGYLDRGEYVIKKSSVNKYGRGLLDMINEGKVPAKKMKSLLG